MRVLIACEESGVVRSAFESSGHEAWSCDLLPSRKSGNHFQGSIWDLLDKDYHWDLLIAHPPCTDLAVSGAKHFPAKIADGRQQSALDFVSRLMELPIDRIAIENPVSVISTKIRKPDQIIQPYMFGHEASKKTCLWLKNLPPLIPTDLVGVGSFDVTKSGRRIPSWYNLPPSPYRARIRSQTFEGIARAMADQWGVLT